MSIQIWYFSGLTGGGPHDLDGFDYNRLGDGHGAIVIEEAVTRFYYYDTTSSAAESSPNVIKPDNNNGDGRWLLSTATP